MEQFHKLMPPGTPQRNGVSERHNHTIIGYSAIYDVSYLLTTIVLRLCIRDSTFTLNRAPSKSVETTLYELWFGKKPKLSFLKVWGCDAYVKKFQHDKLRTQIGEVRLHRIPKRNCWVYLLSQIRRQDLCC